MTKTQYIQKMYAILAPMCIQKGYHNVAAGMIAQSIQEGWNSGLATKYYNYWGMKAGESYKGKKVAMNNKAGNDPAVYRVYTSMEDGCKGYFAFLNYARYKSLKNCTTDDEYLSKIGPCGWNSNPGYGDRCKSHLKEVYNALSKENTSHLPTLKQGDRNDYVRAWQNYLSFQGYPLKSDGIFGPLTEQAVKDWQKETGLQVTGIITPLEWNSIGVY